MKYRKMLRRGLSLILALSTLFIFSPFALAATTEAAQAAAYDALPDDAIVCYMYGQPVYKYEVDENGIVTKDFSMNSNARSSAVSNTLPSRHREEFIRATCTLVTTGFSQNENIFYVPCDDAAIIYSTINNGKTAVSIATAISSKFGSVGKALSNIFKTMAMATLNSISADVEELVDADKHVNISITTSQYGQFINVTQWNGTSCVRYGYTDSTTTYTVVSVVCDTHGESVWG